MKINEIINEAKPSDFRDYYRSLSGKYQAPEVDKDDSDDAELGTDYTDIASKVMGWPKDKPIKIRAVAKNDSGNEDESYYENSSEKVRETIDRLNELADRDGFEVIVDYWNKNTKWAIGVLLSNNRKVRIMFDTKGDIKYVDLPIQRNADQTDTIKILDSILSGNDRYSVHSTQYQTVIKSSSGKFTLEEYWKIVTQLEDIMTDEESAKALSIKPINKKARSAGGMITRNVSQFKYYLGVATMIYVAVRFGLKNIVPRGGSEGNSKGTFDLNDKGITIGMSAAGKRLLDAGQKPYREHAVPCDAIIKAAIKMIQADSGSKSMDDPNRMDPRSLINTELIGRVAKMIKRNLVIVLISDEERRRIDFDLGYLSTMPEGEKWDPENDNVLSRLKAGEIKIYSLDGKSKLSE